MPNLHLFIFGMGYTALHLAATLHEQGWQISGTTRRGGAVGNGFTATTFANPEAVLARLESATHILSSVPPDRDTGTDPVLDNYGEAIANAGANKWVGYISATGVYGDVEGAWVDESAPIGSGRRTARAAADLGWQDLRDDVRVFRLPGIYGPGRSVLDRLRDGSARSIDKPGQVFSRCHVADIASGIIAGFSGPPGVYNLADDQPCAQHLVTSYGAELLGMDPPPLQSMEEAELSPMARKFYSENRRVANGKAKRVLGWEPLYPTYKHGLRAILEGESGG
ncbi:SDR family NAD(P)-dependent oxidoreductase [Alterisphingorhabdus coralli]|uniref:SDR family NAD(P)-dependent oxidoreductase n=1 Tax=Alterisphingorhabdus coralli TaxID=3071408 RepID=A0AA97F924_9SPHN|nr:SDR family NAD(P)-dependent oxidoreductase [Parasphingorhabdus sp. SCSIO 66989]WOE75282.1 SDR family NAD(P)-dependent oxidoreductase [Parasphingorhabdus sp. SCSIO 66989]